MRDRRIINGISLCKIWCWVPGSQPTKGLPSCLYLFLILLRIYSISFPFTSGHAPSPSSTATAPGCFSWSPHFYFEWLHSPPSPYHHPNDSKVTDITAFGQVLFFGCPFMRMKPWPCKNTGYLYSWGCPGMLNHPNIPACCPCFQ